jgi:hypothetical protein
MDKSSRETSPTTRSGFGPRGDASALRVNGAASIAELKEFLGTLKGRDPQQVIGIVSSSLLVQSVAMAVIGTVLGLALFTVGPYLMYGPPKAKSVAAKPEKPAATPAVAPSATPGANAKASDAKSNQPDAARAAKSLGIDEVKSADANKNPLDKGPNLDNLLDGLDK